MKKKIFMAVFAMALVLIAAVGGTFAWLIASTDPVTNTFTYGDINITLTETTGETYKIVPGNDIAKDPKVTVKNGSEACWLFVKLEEENWPALKTATSARKVDYAVAEGWTALENNTGVYYRDINETVTADADYPVLKDNIITVSGELTKEEIANLDKSPTLTLTAYAVQKSSSETAADAWAKISTN